MLLVLSEALGHLRDMLDKTVQAKLKAAIDKDLNKTPLEELPAHLAGIE